MGRVLDAAVLKFYESFQESFSSSFPAVLPRHAWCNTEASTASNVINEEIKLGIIYFKNVPKCR